MKRLVAAAGSGLIFLCAAFSAIAEPRDSVERGQRLDSEAMRDDVRTNRLQVPRHPLVVEQPLQLSPDPGAKAKPKKAKSSKATFKQSAGSSQ